jgi:transglutaminase-like putative cysteine protease
MRFQITHVKRFTYEKPTYDSHNELRMRPWNRAGQRCIAFNLSVDQSAAILAYNDFFGNHAHSLSVSRPHDSLTIVARSVVENSPTPANEYHQVPFSVYLSDDELRAKMYYEFVSPSRYIPFSDRLRKFFWMAAQPRGSEEVAAYVMRIVTLVLDQFEYETGTTHVHSSLDDILKSGGGVCQDFAHLTIGILRLAGVPARYVSGYLAPVSSQRQGANVGAQASHAWLEAMLPGSGWTGFDPTHRCRMYERHLGVAIGRDYVPPSEEKLATSKIGAGRLAMRCVIGDKPGKVHVEFRNIIKGKCAPHGGLLSTPGCDLRTGVGSVKALRSAWAEGGLGGYRPHRHGGIRRACLR